jgi:hypothetical protein
MTGSRRFDLESRFFKATVAGERRLSMWHSEFHRAPDLGAVGLCRLFWLRAEKNTVNWAHVFSWLALAWGS